MLIKFSIESGVNVAEIYGEVDPSDKKKALEEIGNKAQGLFLALHPEMKPNE